MTTQSDPDSLPGFEHLAAPAERTAKRSGPSREELLEGLNEPQRAAVVHEGTPLLVVAGGGGGKSEGATRGGGRARIMWVSTFHSACVRILRKEITALDFGGVAYKSSFSIYDAADQKRLMTNVAKELDLDAKRFPPGALLHWVSDHKNE